MKKLLASIIVGTSLATAATADSLVVYSAGPKPLSAGLVDGFTAKTGIEVELFQSSSGKVMARYEAEKANPQVDVIISAAWGHAITLDQAGELLEYQSSNALNVPESLKTSAYTAQGAAALAIAYNTQSGLSAPKAWADLTKAEYKDKVTMPDPSASGSALTLLQGLVHKNGDDAWSMFEGLKANNMIVPGANNAALTPVLQGAKGVVFGAVDYIALGAQAKGESLEVIYPSEGTVLAPRPIMIAKSSNKQDVAKQFVDYVLSEEGQEMVAERLILPARTDIKAQRPGYDELDIISLNAVEATKTAVEAKDRFSKIFD